MYTQHVRAAPAHGEDAHAYACRRRGAWCGAHGGTEASVGRQGAGRKGEADDGREKTGCEPVEQGWMPHETKQRRKESVSTCGREHETHNKSGREGGGRKGGGRMVSRWSKMHTNAIPGGHVPLPTPRHCHRPDHPRHIARAPTLKPRLLRPIIHAPLLMPSCTYPIADAPPLKLRHTHFIPQVSRRLALIVQTEPGLTHTRGTRMGAQRARRGTWICRTEHGYKRTRTDEQRRGTGTSAAWTDMRHACRWLEMNAKFLLSVGMRTREGRKLGGWARGRRRQRRAKRARRAGRGDGGMRIGADGGLVRLAWAVQRFALLYKAGDVERHPGPVQQEGAKEQETHTTRRLVTLNVDGSMKLKGKRGGEDDWGDGSVIDAETTRAWREIMDVIEGSACWVLTDVGMSGAQMRAARARLEKAHGHRWQTAGTPGWFSAEGGRRVGGVLIGWDERCYTRESTKVVMKGRVMRVMLQDAEVLVLQAELIKRFVVADRNLSGLAA